MTIRHHHRRLAAEPRRRSLGERGETLIELMATIILLGTGVVAVVSMLFTTIVLTAQYRSSSRANLVVHDFAEVLKQPSGTFDYKPCATDSGGADPYPEYTGAPANFTTEVVAVEHWTGATDAGGQLEWSSSCVDNGLQRLTLVATTQPGRHQRSERLVIVKRDTSCPVPGDFDPGEFPDFEALPC